MTDCSVECKQVMVRLSRSRINAEQCFTEWRHDSLAGLLDEGDGYEDSGPQEDEGEENDRLHH